MMKNQPHDPSALQTGPTDQVGRPLTYSELVMAFRAKMGLPAGKVQEMELEPLAQ